MSQFALSWDSAHRGVVIVVATFAGGYLCYWFIANSAALRALCERRFEGQRAHTMYILFQRLVGIVFLGAPAAVVTVLLPDLGFRSVGIVRVESIATLYWILGISAAVVPLVFAFSRSPRFVATYPLIREKNWGRFLIVANTASWCVYIPVYEFLFRGFLLGVTAASFGVWPAILVNVALYACVHIPYGFSVTLGSVPLGIALCMATVHTGNIWTACVVHLLVALLNDYVAAAANPGTRLSLR